MFVNHRTITKISFGSVRSPAVLEISMKNADLSGKELGTSGAILIAAFLPKCQ
jgi:hypothetical protein